MDREPQSWWKDYQLKEEKKRRANAQRTYFFECRRERQIKRNARLAEKITDAPMLVAALRFYVHHLSPGAPTFAENLFDHCKGVSRRWRLYLKIARRVLGVGYERHDPASKAAPKIHPGLENRKTLQLPAYWERRMRRIGLCLNTVARAQFERLSPDLEIDASARVFATQRPYLIPNVQRLLLGEAPPLVRVHHPVAEADIPAPGSCAYLMHSSEDPSYVSVPSPFKIAPSKPKPSRPPQYEPPEGDGDDEW